VRSFRRIVLATSGDVDADVVGVSDAIVVVVVVVALDGQARRVVLRPFSDGAGVESLCARQRKVLVVLGTGLVVAAFLDLREVPLLGAKGEN